jgi:hypothetical protein
VVIFPESWSAAARAVYDAATLVDDNRRQEALIFQESGEMVDLVW